MRKQYAKKIWKRYIGLVAHGGADTMVTNPAVELTIRTQSGELNEYPDEAYNTVVADVEDLQAIFLKTKERSAGELLLEALAKTDIDQDDIEAISERLAECSKNTNYKKQDAQNQSSGAEKPAGAAQCAWTPKQIYDKLNTRIRGQDEAKRAAAIMVYNMLHGRRSNAVFAGPSGTGKTEIWRCFDKMIPGHIWIIDASRLAGDGWRGSVHVRDIFEGIDVSGGLIVVMDEADKTICETIQANNGTDYSAIVQNSLLKMLDGDRLEFAKEDNRKAFAVDCSTVSVVLCGTFETLIRNKDYSYSAGFGGKSKSKHDHGNVSISHDDLMSAGMRREIAGRINRIVQLRPLTVDDYRAILAGPVLRDLQAATKGKIEIDDESVSYLAERAQATGMGVRWAKSQIGNVIDDLVFENPKSEEYTVQIPASGRSGQQRCMEQSVCVPMPGP